MSSRRNAVLAAVQDTRGGRRALEWAWEESLLRDCVLEVVDVVSKEGLQEQARDQLLRMVAAARGRHDRHPVVSTQVVTGDPVEVLVARSSDVELLVVGSHGVSGMLHAVEPAVSDALTRLAGCPVVVVPSSSPALPAPDASPPAPASRAFQ